MKDSFSSFNCPSTQNLIKKFLISSSIPTQYASHLENDCSGTGDVVIVVPSMDNLPERSDTHSHHICIDTEGEVEPISPKTITESSSK